MIKLLVAVNKRVNMVDALIVISAQLTNFVVVLTRRRRDRPVVTRLSTAAETSPLGVRLLPLQPRVSKISDSISAFFMSLDLISPSSRVT